MRTVPADALPLHPPRGNPARLTRGQLAYAIGDTEPNGTPTVLATVRRAAQQRGHLW